MKYAVIHGDSVDKETWEAARKALAGAMKEFCLPPVTIKWFAPSHFVKNANETFERDSDLRGAYRWSDDNSIYVQAYQLPDAIAETVLHEVCHLKARIAAHGCNADVPTETEEALVEEYVADMMRRGVHKDMDTYIDYLSGKDWSENPKKTYGKSSANSEVHIKSVASPTGGERRRKTRYGRVGL